jgi:predicted permease
MQPKPRPLADRMLRLLLRLLPFDFRADHGREIEQVFRAQRRETHGFGGLVRVWSETVQDVLTTAPRQHLQLLRQDVAYALRILRRAPGFTAAATITFAVGIGGATSVFTVVNAFVFRPLPVERPGELVSIAALDSHFEMPHAFSFPDLQDYRRGQAAFSDIAGFESSIVWISDGTASERVLVDAVTGNYFPLLGVAPAAGRLISANEAWATGDSPIIVLTYDYWQRRFAGDPTVVGRLVRVNGQALTIVGVVEEGFTGINPLVRISGFVPVSMLDVLTHRDTRQMPMLEARDQEGLTLVGRLAPGTTIDQARAALGVVTDRLAAEYPATNAGRTLLVVPEARARPHPSNGPQFRAIAAIFSALSGLLLVIASANIATILLARATARSREVALRSALGARRGRIVRQFLTESVVLAALGGAAAIPLAAAASRLFEQTLQSSGLPVPVGVDFSLDWRVLTVCWAVAVLAGMIAGLAPALYAFRADIHSPVKVGGFVSTGSRGMRIQRGLIVGQIAVSLALSIFAGLFVRALNRAETIDLGFRTADVMLAQVDLRSQGYDDAQRRSYFTESQQRVAALPGVRRASWASGLPFGYSIGFVPLHVDGVTTRDGRPPATWTMSIDQEYLAAMSIAVHAGRSFDERDDERSKPVAIANQALAEQLWPGGNAIGRRVRLEPGGPPIEIVGVIANTKLIMLWESPRPLLIRPLAQHPSGSAVLQIISDRPSAALADTVRRTLQALDQNVTPYDVQTMTRYLDGGNGFFLFRVGAMIAGGFGLLGLLLASTGVYGVMACYVTQRTTEFGVRMALGAERGAILREVLVRGGYLAATGTVFGLLVAAAIARFLRVVLLGVSPFDPATYVTLAFVLIAVCLAAAFVPAWRATAVDPVEALRAS